jgi:hypothetical protein
MSDPLKSIMEWAEEWLKEQEQPAHPPLDLDEQRRIHEADCLDVKGRPYCGYECPKCGLCTKWSHGRHKAAPCQCRGES